MALAKAARDWIEAKEEIDRLKPQLEAAAEELKEYFRKSGKAKRGRIGYSKASRLQLDQPAVKAELGKRLPKFQKRTTYETLSLLP